MIATSKQYCEPPKERVTTVPSKYKLPTYSRVLIGNVHARAIAPSATMRLRLLLMADADEIVLESTEIQTEK